MKKTIATCILAVFAVNLMFASGTKDQPVTMKNDEPVKMEWLISKSSVEVDPVSSPAHSSQLTGGKPAKQRR